MSAVSVQRRSFSAVSALLKESQVKRTIKPAFKPHYSNPKNETRSFMKNLPLTTPEIKPWDAEGITKDRFFKRKYGKMSDERRQALQEKVARQRRFRAMKKEHEARKREEEWAQRNPGKVRRNPHESRQTAKDIIGGGGPFGPFFEFVYGTHAVKAVLEARRRPVLGLYTFNCSDDQVLKRAETEYGVKVETVKDKNVLNILTNNGVHNGLVLKTKPLDVPYIQELGHSKNGEYKITTESENGSWVEQTKRVVRAEAVGLKELEEEKKEEEEEGEQVYPLGLYLDEITDPHNIGSILRSAYFFGVDFVVIPNHASAKMGPVANKSSAGALDLIDVYQASSGLQFIDKAKENGWNVISTSGSKPDSQTKDKHEEMLRNKFIKLANLKTVLKRTPVMLVIGSEGAGVRTNLKLRSDYLVEIPKLRSGDDIVDSLNVGVATGVVIQSCI
ncbi:uncharacterized protein LODBEIA_P01200 [Lodderomyces beijingensis]|uniref:rRNA methyltransferase 1, mitochondrial n=1 Tax=Lodderomyces beijingensis TaxID=1775926 RepID=A0ABP0ZGB8_9ASCO